jgi:hypothetical protein
MLTVNFQMPSNNLLEEVGLKRAEIHHQHCLGHFQVARILIAISPCCRPLGIPGVKKEKE